MIIALMLVGGMAMVQGYRKSGNCEVNPQERAERMTEYGEGIFAERCVEEGIA